MRIFKVPYWISNNGDGSASVHPTATLAEAEAEDEAQSEGWGENCANALTLKIEEGRLFAHAYIMAADGLSGQRGWIEITEKSDG